MTAVVAHGPSIAIDGVDQIKLRLLRRREVAEGILRKIRLDFYLLYRPQ
jgi:hypothetical protein